MVEEAVDKDLSKDLPTGVTFPKSPEEKTSQDQGSERRRSHVGGNSPIFYSLTQSAVHKDVPTYIESDPGERPSSSIAREIPQHT